MGTGAHKKNGMVTMDAAEMLPMKPNESPEVQDTTGHSGIHLKRSLGLFNGVAIISGIIIGSGIFVSPKGVLLETGSIGLALVVWTLSGFLCLLGAHCFAELGTCITKSGAQYAYLQEAFGPLSAFLYMWIFLLITAPTANAIIALTFAEYIVYPFFPDCQSPEVAIRLLAAGAIALLTFVNCASVNVATKVQNVFTVIKILALCTVIFTGLVQLIRGETKHFDNAFEGSNTNPGSIALAFYSGLFSYSGWYSLNFLTEELKNPYRNLPWAIWISLPLVTVIYVLANVAYFTILTPAEILGSDAVAVSFAMKMFGMMAWVMPVFVACSTFGSLNGCIMSVSRLFFVGAREGQLPEALALISLNTYTPIPSLMFECTMSLFYLGVQDIFMLINICSFVEALVAGVSVAALLYLRYSKPNLKRPIKVNLAAPTIFLIISVFLVVIPIVLTPQDTLYAVIVIITGIPVYWIFILWKKKPKVIRRLNQKFTILVQRAIMGVPGEEYKLD
ncbi:unnamed protein product [Owenia fusiformis]|uniref:Uncharacterized protein n=1 Tax=Owenia fusiformis TaxID=6347 RepID=A0A8J1TV70_OWEFU|nr:unnamed protein product [Owenia fusiformis]